MNMAHKEKLTGTEVAGETIDTPLPVTVGELMRRIAGLDPLTLVLPRIESIGFVYPYTIIETGCFVEREDTRDYGPRYKRRRAGGIPAVFLD
jgi:hypothetical protein